MISKELINNLDPQSVRLEITKRRHVRFMEKCWINKTDDFVVGLHTERICERIDQAIEDFRNGISSFIRIAVHPRAGKSDMIAVYLPPRFLALFNDSYIMNISYSGDKSSESSMNGMRIVKSETFRELFPGFGVGRNAVTRWNLSIDGKETLGNIFATGLYSGITGHGYQLGILDDYCGSRQSAESVTQRQRMWSAFTNDFLTRRAPVSITIILATWWHEDDIHGRIEKKNNPGHEDYDPAFPQFEFLSFPARREMAPEELQPKYPGKYLFLERFGSSWYETQYATLGEYSASAMMDCNPMIKGGNFLEGEKVVIHNSEKEVPDGLRWYRVWDYAHSAKQRTGDDPDYTGGTLLAFRQIGYNKELKEKIWELWIKDYEQFRKRAIERDNQIVQITHMDGPSVTVLIENSLDSLDGADYLKAKLIGLRNVITVTTKGDKLSRIAPVEPVFSNGNVHIVRGEWNSKWLYGINHFDGTGKTHDEMIDNISCGYKHICVGSGYGILRNPYL